jgi:hypothetical protein
MGSQYSSEKKEKKQKIINELNCKDSGLDSYTSYQGVISDRSSVVEGEKKISESAPFNSEIAENKEKSKLSQTTTSEQSKVEKVMTTFKWKEGGNLVYVTGSFSNWTQWFLMSRSEKNPNEFEVSLELPLGVIQYKFIVDSVWRAAKDQQQENDGRGNINNILNNNICYVQSPMVKST